MSKIKRDNENDEAKIINYLLGELPAAEKLDFEKKYFEDDNMFRLLKETEDELIDQYVRGELSLRQKERFENYFLSTQERQDKVAFAREFLEIIDEQPVDHVSLMDHIIIGIERFKTNIQGAFDAVHLKYAFSFAIIILIIGGKWAIFKINSFKNQLEMTRLELNDLKQQLALESAKPVFVEFSLTPGLLRQGEGYRAIAIPRDVALIRLELEVWSEAEYQDYRIMIQNEKGTELIRLSQLELKKSEQRNFIELQLSQAILGEGKHILLLQGRDNKNLFQRVSVYYLSILKN
jgi:hypothetical protein